MAEAARVFRDNHGWLPDLEAQNLEEAQSFSGMVWFARFHQLPINQAK